MSNKRTKLNVGKATNSIGAKGTKVDVKKKTKKQK
jgi:hypothetical protein